jgi:AraC-like DNA-binding protein
MARSSFALTKDLKAFFGEPERRYVVFRSFAYWQAERRAFGTMIWGRPDEQDVEHMCAAHEVGANPLFAGHTSLVDIRALEAVDKLAFERLLAYLVRRRDDWSPNVARQAVLHRGGVAQATVAGMFQFLKPGHPVAFFDDARAAHEWIGALDVSAELEALRDKLLGVPDIVRRVRAAFENLPRATTKDIARALGTSTRTLQRHLMASGSSLRAERQQHLLRASARLLEGTELDLSAIAAEVGASSSSHLVALYRAHHGTTPAAYRARKRSG